MKQDDDLPQHDRHYADRWQAVTERYSEIQAEVMREHLVTHGAQTSAHLQARAQIARVELEELKREIASSGESD
jgi:predicted P-loop ATPase